MELKIEILKEYIKTLQNSNVNISADLMMLLKAAVANKQKTVMFDIDKYCSAQEKKTILNDVLDKYLKGKHLLTE